VSAGQRCGTGTRTDEATHLCPVRRCGWQVPMDKLIVPGTWRMVPKALQRAVWGAWRSGAGGGTPAHTTACLVAIRAVDHHLEAKAVTVAPPRPRPVLVARLLWSGRCEDTVACGEPFRRATRDSCATRLSCQMARDLADAGIRSDDPGRAQSAARNAIVFARRGRAAGSGRRPVRPGRQRARGGDPVNLRPRQRAWLLDIARDLTSCADDPAAVAANALVLTESAGQASDPADLQVRIHVLQQQRSARVSELHKRRHEPPRPDPCLDNPGEFLHRAQVLYAFAIADAAADSWSWS
jgi:hypothetical protein